MATLKRILLATDLSSCSERAADFAVTLAQRLQAEVVIAHVTVMPPGLPDVVLARSEDAGEGPPHSTRDYVVDSAARDLEPLRQRFQDAGIQTRVAIDLGPIAETILALTRREAPDLVIVGSHGHTGLRHLLLGSIAEQLLRTCPVPILTVRGDGSSQLD